MAQRLAERDITDEVLRHFKQYISRICEETRKELIEGNHAAAWENARAIRISAHQILDRTGDEGASLQDSGHKLSLAVRMPCQKYDCL